MVEVTHFGLFKLDKFITHYLKLVTLDTTREIPLFDKTRTLLLIIQLPECKIT